MTKTGEEVHVVYGVEIRWSAESHVLTFTAKEYDTQPDGTRHYYAFDEAGMGWMSPTWEKGERYVEGVVKWDGCSHVTFGDGNGYLHLCGGAHFARLFWTLRRVTELAQAHIDVDECADFPIPTDGITDEDD